MNWKISKTGQRKRGSEASYSSKWRENHFVAVAYSRGSGIHYVCHDARPLRAECYFRRGIAWDGHGNVLGYACGSQGSITSSEWHVLFCIFLNYLCSLNQAANSFRPNLNRRPPGEIMVAFICRIIMFHKAVSCSLYSINAGPGSNAAMETASDVHPPW